MFSRSLERLVGGGKPRESLRCVIGRKDGYMTPPRRSQGFSTLAFRIPLFA